MHPLTVEYHTESGMVLIPIVFEWRHGGRTVYLSGSFNRWTQTLMASVEGCPGVFQALCSLPPGYHQFKFVVDGEWRHDELRPFITCNIGTVNTIYVSHETEYQSPMLSPQVSPQAPISSMEEDDEVTFQRVVRVSGPESSPMISKADLKNSRERVVEFLSKHFAYELLPESGKVIALDVELPVKQAFHIFHEQGISMAPLWDFSKGKFVGVLSAQDFILIMKELRRHGSNLTEEELETHTISAWKEAKSFLNSQINGLSRDISRGLVHAGPDENLKDIAMKILQSGFATIPILHSSSADGSNPHLLHLASLSGILKCICRFFKHSPSSLSVLQFPLSAVPLGSWAPKVGEPNQRPLAFLRSNVPLSVALNLLIQAQVSSIPIVDDNDSLVDVYSRSDITSLAKDRIYTRINLEETSIYQALQYRDDRISPYGYHNQSCHMCLRSEPLHKIFEKLSLPGVRRLVVVEAGSKHVEGIVSLTDVFRFLLGS